MYVHIIILIILILLLFFNTQYSAIISFLPFTPLRFYPSPSFEFLILPPPHLQFRNLNKPYLQSFDKKSTSTLTSTAIIYPPTYLPLATSLLHAIALATLALPSSLSISIPSALPLIPSFTSARVTAGKIQPNAMGKSSTHPSKIPRPHGPSLEPLRPKFRNLPLK